MSERVTYLAVVQKLDADDKPMGEPDAMEHADIGRAEKWCRLRMLGKGGRAAQLVILLTPDRCEVKAANGIVRPADVWDEIERLILDVLEGIIKGIRKRWAEEDRRPKGADPDTGRRAREWREAVNEARKWAAAEVVAAGAMGVGPSVDLEHPPEPVAGVQWFGEGCDAVAESVITEPIPAHFRHAMDPGTLPENIGEIVVGVVDTGCRVYHETLRAAQIEVIDCTGRGLHDSDPNGHGTAVVSQIVGRTAGGIRFGGAVGVKVVAAGSLDPRSGVGIDSWIARGVRACVKAGCRVVNMSLGGDTPLPETERAIREANRAGVLVVAAAGNGGPGKGGVSYPARYPEAFAVSAVGDSDAYAGFSQRGEGEDISARGANQLVAIGANLLGVMSGTSMAAPHVTAAAARVLATGDELYGQEMDGERARAALADEAEPGKMGPGDGQALPLVMLCEPAEGSLGVPTPVDPPKPNPPGDTVNVPVAELDRIHGLLGDIIAAVDQLRPCPLSCCPLCGM